MEYQPIFGGICRFHLQGWGINMSFRNVYMLSTSYAPLYTRRQDSSDLQKTGNEETAWVPVPYLELRRSTSVCIKRTWEGLEEFFVFHEDVYEEVAQIHILMMLIHEQTQKMLATIPPSMSRLPRKRGSFDVSQHPMGLQGFLQG
jgi:hypothetical protein